MAAVNDDDEESLEDLVADEDLAALERLIGRFNIFDALWIERAEIRHSNFLAFLLDPAESHGQGQLFLKALLMDLLRAAPREVRPIRPIALDGTDLRGVEIKREWKHIDLQPAAGRSARPSGNFHALLGRRPVFGYPSISETAREHARR